LNVFANEPQQIVLRIVMIKAAANVVGANMLAPPRATERR
jgi:hypothetical protein